MTLNRYRAPERLVQRHYQERAGRPLGDHLLIGEHVHRGFEGSVHLPIELAEIVTAVIGLDNRRLGGPAGTGSGDPSRSELPFANSHRRALQFSTATATARRSAF